MNTADKVCSPDTIACSLEFASSAIQTWNGAAYGDCSVVTCDAQSIQSGSVCTGACSAIGAAATMTAAQTVTGALATTGLMLLALSAYATYLVNAGQFLLKLRAARLQAPAYAMGVAR